MEHAAYVGMMQMLDDSTPDKKLPIWRLALMLLGAPEYSLADLRRWREGTNRGSGPIWLDYRGRDLMAEMPEMPVPMLPISGAQDLNTPVELAARWYEAVEAPRRKRYEIFARCGHTDFLSIRLDQAVFLTQIRSALTSAFAVSINFLMTATMATFAGFPAARSATYFALRSGLNRIATRAGM